MIRLLENLQNFFWFKRYRVKYKKFPKVQGVIFLKSAGECVVGENVTIFSKLDANPVGGGRAVIIVRGGAKLTISDGAGISNSVIYCAKHIHIGRNVSVGANCYIYDTDFHSIHLSERLQVPEIGVKTSAIIINDGAFIGAHSIILKGVTIGKESVVGAGSVVTKDIPDFQVWAGNPARFIKYVT